MSEMDCDAEKNVICLKCFGLLEMRCGCNPKWFKTCYCTCEKPKRSDQHGTQKG